MNKRTFNFLFYIYILITRITFVLIAWFSLQYSVAQTNHNINLLSNFAFPSARGLLNDVWGMKKGAKEYAFVGFEDGVAIVDVTNPTIPVEVFYVQGVFNAARDLKTFNNHLYVVNEGSGGLMIIDLNPLPGTLTMANVTFYTGNATFPVNTAHNLFIDENGIVYLCRTNKTADNYILSVFNNPKAPVHLGIYNDFELHDAYVRNDTLWGAAIRDAIFVVVDVSNKALPITMASQPTSSLFTHNIWPTNDGQTVFTTDEVSGAYLDAYDVSNLNNITLLDKVQSSPGQNVVPHNTFFLNNFLITSYYTDGVLIHDVSDPTNMIEVGNYDTSPALSGSGSGGCWGVYPYLPSGIILASDRQNGLFVLGPSYVQAARLKGNVTNALTFATLDAVNIELVSTTTSTSTNLIGNYSTGIANAGIYDVIYSKTGFVPDTIFNLMLTAGTTVVQNVQLTPLVTSITELNNTDDIEIFPNPFQNSFTIKIPIELQNEILIITITDISGRLIDNYQFNGSQLKTFQPQLQKGVYFIKIQANKHIITNKKIIKR